MRWLVFSHIFIALCAVSLTLETIVFSELELSKNIPYLVVVFCATLVVYNLKGIKQVQSNSITLECEKGKWIRKNSLTLKLIFISGCIVCFGGLFFLDNLVIYALLPLGFLSIGYSLPIVIKNVRVSLREIAFVKVLLVAFVWTIVVSFLPLINSDEFYSIKWWKVITDFMFLLALAMLFDIKDMKHDRQNNIITTPLLIGINGTKVLSASIIIFRLLLLLLFVGIQGKYLLGEIIIGVLCLIMVLKIVTDTRLDYFYMLYIDGLMILKSFVLLLIYFKD